jgi:prepilin-type N-terminal cleavage/methylation domain-containing protein
MTRKWARQDGFTLFEILVGLVISSLIMVGLTASMRTVNAGWDAATAAIERQGAFAGGLPIIAEDIAHIERLANKTGQKFLFGGSPAEAAFIIAERDSQNRAGLYWVRLLVRSEAGVTELVRMRAPYRAGDEDPVAIDWKDEVVLLRGPYEIEMNYRAPRSGVADWRRYWEGENRLPQQFRLMIGDRSAGISLPEIVLALRIDAEVQCLANPGAGCTMTSRGVLQPPEEQQQ